ncbi:MAG: alpha/beta fold hydrolase [Pseudomonadales bacterium]|nr:alpha/beta fold hydrolase [Pseudomonadales bacterium]
MFKQKLLQYRLVAIAFVILAITVVLPRIPSASTKLAERHLSEPPLPSIKYSASLNYKDYVGLARELITDRNPRASEVVEGAAGMTVLDFVAPKQWPLDPNCNKPTLGMLLIHGLSDSPYSVSDVGNHFSQNCVLVRSVLLPGHSTVPGDLAQVSYQDWIDASSWAMESFSEEVDKLVVVGFSSGATLAIDYAIRKQNRETNRVPLIKTGDSRAFNGESSQLVGLVLLSPAIAINTSAAFLARWVDNFGAVFYEPLRWATIAEDRDYTKYESFHMNAAAQIYMLTKRLGSTLDMKHPIPVPVLIVASEQDTTTDTSETIQFFHNRTGTNSQMLLYASQELKTGDSRIEVRNSENSDKRILSQSHISILISPVNPHYGEKGDYVNCLHYSDESQLSSCLDWSNSDILYGEITKKNRDKGTLRRISWNPDYQYMMDRIDQFIGSL